MNLIGAQKNVYEGHIELEVEYILSKECFVIPHAEYQGYLFLYWITFVIILVKEEGQEQNQEFGRKE